MDQSVVLEPPPGTILGETDYSLPGQISDSNNVRYVDGRPQPIGGWSKTIITAAGQYVSVFEWIDASGDSRVVLGGLDKVILHTSNTNITPSGFTTTTRWSFAPWGEELLANPTGGTLYDWDLNTANDLTAITNAPDNITVMGVTHTRQVMAFGCNEEVSTTFNGRCIRFSDAEDNTDWTTTASNLAGEYILDGSGGAIKAAKALGDDWLVWTDDEVFFGTYTSDPSNPWVFRRIAMGYGCVGQDAAVVVGGAAYWITKDLRLVGMIIGAPPFELPGLPVHYITSAGGVNVNKSGMNNGFVWHNRTFNEIWFHFVVSGSTYPTKYIGFNLDSLGTDRPIWFPGTITRAAMHQGMTGIYGVLADTSNTQFYTHETGKQGESGDLLTWYWSMMVYLDKGKRRVMVKRLVPDVENQAGNVTLTVSALPYPQGAETTLQTKTLAVGDDRSDFRASGRLIRVKFSGNDGTGSTDTFARFGSTTAEFVVLGER